MECARARPDQSVTQTQVSVRYTLREMSGLFTSVRFKGQVNTKRFPRRLGYDKPLKDRVTSMRILIWGLISVLMNPLS